MLKSSGESSNSKRDLFIVVISLVNAFTWFFLAQFIISGILEGITVTDAQELIIQSGYYSGIVLSLIIGSVVANRTNRLKFIYAWIILGIATSLIPLFFSSFTWLDCSVISILLGASFGLGIPSCLAYFADITHFGNRGRISGITLLIINMAAPIFFIAASGLDLTANLILFAVWRSLGLIVFFLKPIEKLSTSERKASNSFSGILKDKIFGFYIIAWIMFCLVDRVTSQIAITSLGDIADIITILGPIVASISALIAGIGADRIGRKRIALYGFISLGIAYAIIGIFPNEPLAGYFFTVINSITTGILWVTFILIVWGDISQSGSREKYYTLGEIPFFLTKIIGLFLTTYVLKIPETRIFSVAAFFLFLAVLPLLYVPETLPEKKMELRRLRSFAEEARKAKEKYERKK